MYLPSIPYSLHMGVTIPEEGRELTPYPLPCIPPCSYQYYRMLFTYRCYGFKLTNYPHRTFSFDQFYFIVTIKPPIIIFINLFLLTDFFKGEHKRNTGVKGVLRINSSLQILKLREIIENHVKSKSK